MDTLLRVAGAVALTLLPVIYAAKYRWLYGASWLGPGPPHTVAYLGICYVSWAVLAAPTYCDNVPPWGAGTGVALFSACILPVLTTTNTEVLRLAPTAIAVAVAAGAFSRMAVSVCITATCWAGAVIAAAALYFVI